MERLNKRVIKGSLVLLVTFNLYNLLGFIFQTSMARLLSVAEYGVLATLFSFIYLFGIPAESIQTAMTKYVADEPHFGKIKSIVKRAFGKLFIFSFWVFMAFVVVSWPLSNLLKIDFPILVLTGTMIFIAFLSPINRGVMQGRKEFGSLGLNVIVEGLVKVFLSIFIVLSLSKVGFLDKGVYGAMIATILASCAALAISFLSLQKIFQSEGEKSDAGELKKLIRPSFIISLLVFIFLSMDIFIARIVFSPEDSGTYAIASTLGKILFLAAQPISRVMFPMSSERNSDSRKSNQIYMTSLIFLFFIVLVFLTAFYFEADLLIYLFSGKQLASAANILIYVALAQSLLSFTNMTLLYKLSRNKTKRAGYLFIAALLGAGTLFYFSMSLASFSVALVIVNLIFLVGAILCDR